MLLINCAGEGTSSRINRTPRCHTRLLVDLGGYLIDVALAERLDLHALRDCQQMQKLGIAVSDSYLQQVPQIYVADRVQCQHSLFVAEDDVLDQPILTLYGMHRQGP